MPVPGGMYQNQGPTCFDKMKMGFMIGFCVGMASGGLFGGFTALRLAFVLIVFCIKFKLFNVHIKS